MDNFCEIELHHTSYIVSEAVTLIRDIDKLKKDNQIACFIETITNSDAFNNELLDSFHLFKI